MPTTQNWSLKLPECPGNYTFSGKLLITRTIQEDLPPDELRQIINLVRAHVTEQHSTDYLLVFTNASHKRIFCIDQLDATMKQSGDYDLDDDHWTIMYDYEY